MFLDYGLIEACRFLEFVFLHEEYMCHIKLPYIMLVTELHRLPEDLLHLRVVLHVPVYLGLLHQYWDVPKTTIIQCTQCFGQIDEKYQSKIIRHLFNFEMLYYFASTFYCQTQNELTFLMLHHIH